MIDLHTHTTESDGTLTPEELILLAHQKRLSAVALTDHDTIRGIAKAQPVARELGIELVPGIELSTDYLGKEIHILGLYIDDTNPVFLKKLEEFIKSRDLRNEKMAALLRLEGFDITIDALRMEYPQSVITRAHFARYLTEHGFVANRETVFRKYLGDTCRCYVPREKITPVEAIQLIQQGGGASFFAHPVLCHRNDSWLRSFTELLKASGLTGIEAIYSMNTPKDQQRMKRLAKETGLLISGGSDFHGANKPHIHLGTGKGDLSVPDEILTQIKEKISL